MKRELCPMKKEWIQMTPLNHLEEVFSLSLFFSFPLSLFLPPPSPLPLPPPLLVLKTTPYNDLYTRTI
jgi:hypothetical protein